MKDWFFENMERQGRNHKQYKRIIEESIKEEKHYFVNINKKLEWIKAAGYKNIHTIWQNLFGYIIIGEK